MSRAERRRFENEWKKRVWPHWENFIRFKKITTVWYRYATGDIATHVPPKWIREDPRAKAEIVELCDQMLRDLGEDPEVE